MKDKFTRGKEFIAEKLELPLDVILDIPKIVLLGKEELTIENHKGIVSFNNNEIRVDSKNGIIKVEGNNFEILYLGASTLTINGKIKTISYEGIHDEVR